VLTEAAPSRPPVDSVNRVAHLGSIGAGRPATKQPHDTKPQGSTHEGGDVKRGDGHDDDEKLSIHGNPQSDRGRRAGLATRAP